MDVTIGTGVSKQNLSSGQENYNSGRAKSSILVASMKQKTILLTVFAAILAFVFANPAFAAVQQGAASAKGTDQPSALIGNGGIFSEITNVLLFLIGAIAVIMIVIGGLRYVISGGDAKQVDAAKNTILYAIIGIIVALLAYAAVGFVTNTFTAGTQADGTSSSSIGGSPSGGGTSTR